MKTSTKILIVLGVALFVFPAGSMLYDSMANRVDEKVYEEAIEKEGANPKAADKFLTTHQLAAFNNVNIVGDIGPYVNVYLVQSNDYVVKVNKKSDELISCDVDKSGTLNIAASTKGRFFSAISIYIFAPRLVDLSLSNVQLAKLQTEGDSLKIKGNDLNNEIRFAENSNLKYLNITLKNSHITMGSALENWEPNELSGLEKLQLQLDSSSVNLNSKDYEHIDVQLNASTLSNALIREEKGKYSIKHLNLISKGKSTIEFNHGLSVNHVEGHLSDSTSTNLPVYMLRPLIKK